MGCFGRKENSCFYPISDGGLLVKWIAADIRVVREGEGIHELLGHAAGKVYDLVLPKVAIEASVGGTVRVAIAQCQDFRNLR